MSTQRQRSWRLITAAVIVTAVFAVGCGSDSGSTADSGDTGRSVDTAAAPAAVTWRSYQGIQVPFSNVDGPTVDEYSPAPRGYTDTPQGAVLAAIQGQTRLALATDSVWTKVTAALVAPGPGRDAFAIARAASSITTAADPATTAAFTGFRVSSYAGGRAVVDVATTMPGGQLTSVPVTLTRTGDDWKIALPTPDAVAEDPNAPATTDPVPLTSLDGFTEFSAP